MTDQIVESVPLYPMERAQCPFDPPPAMIAEQRAEGISKVQIWNGMTPWLVTGYDLCREVLADRRISGDSDLDGFPSANPGYVARRKVQKTFLNMDNPDHDQMRHTVTFDFTVRRSEQLRPRIQRIVDGLIDDMLAGPKPVDMVEAFSLPLPSMVISEMLGVPEADRQLFYKLGKFLVLSTVTAEEAVGAQGEMFAYMEVLLKKKLEDPQDDLMSRVAVEQVRTGKLTIDQAVAICNMIMIGGFDTTNNMIALGTVALLENPDVLAELRETDDQALIANATEEMLRYLSILHYGRRRVALADVEIAGQLVKAGDGIVIAHDIANRDPDAFPNPEQLDIHRRSRHHLAFGYGIHQCLGQNLSRVELQVVYSTLFRRIPSLRLAAPLDKLRFKSDAVIYGVYELPVTW